ncbi:MAG: hypothetical protein QY309_09120 [Cyclobacteriaceae bacterium]|nr:MAG: hypothetical protein QY309_09120 [Cyclobacteriaceae bacterium]
MKLYNFFLERFLLPLGDLCLGTRFMSSLRMWRSFQYLSASELELIQKQKLDKVLKHARQNIPYYRDLGIPDESDITKFPILTKAIIRDQGDRMLWRPVKKQALICEKSSGSSGIQGQVYMSKQEQSAIQAVQTLFWEWSGYAFGRPLIQTGMTLKRGVVKRLKDIFLRTSYYSAFGLDETSIESALKTLPNRSDAILGGYASSLYVFAQVAREKKLNSIQFSSVISWGDKMFGHYRKLIEEQFNTKVYDTYGATEGLMIAAQRDLDYYYIFTPHVFVEIVDENGVEVPDGQFGRVLVTSLDAFEMPLIRYNIGDLAVKLSKDKYPQKRLMQFPLLERIIGRDTDIVETPSGKKMIVHFFTAIFEHYPQIIQFRVIQRSIHSMIIEFIPSEDFNQKVLNDISRKIQEHLGEEFPIQFIAVDFIPASPSGKPQIIVSDLHQN